jgi:hypothetical protein
VALQQVKRRHRLTRGLYLDSIPTDSRFEPRHFGTHIIDTRGTSWARIADILSAKNPGQTLPLLFAPAEAFAEITACAELDVRALILPHERERSRK